MSITPTNPSGIAGESTINITCTVTLSETGTPTISWSGPMSCDPVILQGVQTSHSDTCEFVRVRQSHAGEYTCEASIGSSTVTATVTVSVVG